MFGHRNLIQKFQLGTPVAYFHSRRPYYTKTEFLSIGIIWKKPISFFLDKTVGRKIYFTDEQYEEQQNIT